MLKIGIIEDDNFLLNTYLEYFKHDKDYFVTFTFDSILALKKATNKLNLFNPDLILLDINLPGISGIEGIPICKKYFPKAKIIMLSAHSDNETIIKALQKGADGYLEKADTSLLQIKNILSNFNNGVSLTTEKVVKSMISYINGLNSNKEETLNKLSKREKEVVSCLINGLTYKKAASELHVNTCTINQHIKKIYVKLEVNSKSELISKILLQDNVL